MDEQTKRKIDRNFFRLSLLPLAGAVAYMFYSAFAKKELSTDYYIVLGVGLALHWLLSDVLSVVFAKGFEGKTEEQKKAYAIYSLLNLAGFGGLGYFACSVGSNNGIFGALVYVMTLSIKRKYLDEYKGIVKKETVEEETAQDAGKAEALENAESETETVEEGMAVETVKTSEKTDKEETASGQ